MNNHVDRLQKDHANARKLAQGLSRIPGISIETDWVHTNIVIFTVDLPNMDASEFCRQLSNNDVHMLNISKSKVRAVTNLTVSGDDIDETLRQIEQLFQVEA
jgi:threonine aldolase